MEAPRRVYFLAAGARRPQCALIRPYSPADQVKELFRAAAEAGPRDILKLYDAGGRLLNIDAELPGNAPPAEPYSLHVAAAHGLAALQGETRGQLRALEARLAAVERQLRAELPLPPAVDELRRQVDAFRDKLETAEGLSWLGFYKKLPEPVSSDECRRLQYRRKSDSLKKRVKENFANICDAQVSDRIRQWLRMPTFDARPWEDEELLLLLQQMYLDHGLCAKFAIDAVTLRNFLYEAYKNYNDVPFHNFRHCFCVAQMLYAISWCVDLPSKIGDLEVLILLTSCICHDLDHPGYNNIYQINAKTELAIRYNDISPLENHHCSVAFRILENEDCNIFKSFSPEDFKQVREGMIRCILATDMARHNEILTNFKEIVPIFNYNDKAHVNLLCMVLIKVSDISNEARPMEVAEPWLDRLLQEFFRQSDAEKLAGLPVTPFMDRDKVTKPSSQCSFIGHVLLPLFEALGDLLTELQDMIIKPVHDALDYYRRLNEATREERLHRKSIVAELHHDLHSPATLSPDTPQSLLKSTSSGSMKTVTSAGGVRKSGSGSGQLARSRSRSTDEEPDASTDSRDYQDEKDHSLEDVQEDTESGDSETATEVEVSEKALKFKINTECNLSTTGRKSYPGSRKGSRERGQHLNHSDLNRMKLRSGALSFDQQCLAGGKKLSFDTPEFLDEYKLTLRKKFEEGLATQQDEDKQREYVVSKETLNLNKRNSEHSVRSNLDESKRSILKCGDGRACEEDGGCAQNNNCAEGAAKREGGGAKKEAGGAKRESGGAKKEAGVAKEGEAETRHARSLLARLRQLTDRLGLSQGGEHGGGGRRASTLPKAKGRAWRLLPGRDRRRPGGWASDADVAAATETAGGTPVSSNCASPKSAQSSPARRSTADAQAPPI